MIAGFDVNFAGKRLHGLMTQMASVAGTVASQRLQHRTVLSLLGRWHSPTQVCKVSRRRLVKDIFDVLDERAVTVSHLVPDQR